MSELGIFNIPMQDKYISYSKPRRQTESSNFKAKLSMKDNLRALQAQPAANIAIAYLVIMSIILANYLF